MTQRYNDQQKCGPKTDRQIVQMEGLRLKEKTGELKPELQQVITVDLNYFLK